uniref:Ribosomal protein S10 n=1 Tax=Panagrolaimus davidi TaxID=227884 RepID=A0A914Q0N4_9BILA
MLTSRIGLNGLTGFVRQTSTFSLSAGIQKFHFFTTSQSLNIKSKEKFLFTQKCNLFESNLLKHGLYYRTFSTKVIPFIEAEFKKALVSKKQWTLVIGRPHICLLQQFIICQSDLRIYDKEKVKRIFNNFDVFTEGVYENKKK